MADEGAGSDGVDHRCFVGNRRGPGGGAGGPRRPAHPLGAPGGGLGGGARPLRPPGASPGAPPRSGRARQPLRGGRGRGAGRHPGQQRRHQPAGPGRPEPRSGRSPAHGGQLLRPGRPHQGGAAGHEGPPPRADRGGQQPARPLRHAPALVLRRLQARPARLLRRPARRAAWRGHRGDPAVPGLCPHRDLQERPVGGWLGPRGLGRGGGPRRRSGHGGPPDGGSDRGRSGGAGDDLGRRAGALSARDLPGLLPLLDADPAADLSLHRGGPGFVSDQGRPVQASERATWGPTRRVPSSSWAWAARCSTIGQRRSS